MCIRDSHYADSVFEVVNRPNEHSKLWENPCKCEHQQSFVGLNDEKGGIDVYKRQTDGKRQIWNTRRTVHPGDADE